LDFDIFPDIKENISQVIIGKARCIRLVLMDLLAEGNVLWEDDANGTEEQTMDGYYYLEGKCNGVPKQGVLM